MLRNRYGCSPRRLAVISSILAASTLAGTAAVGQGTPSGLLTSTATPLSATDFDPGAAGLAVPGQALTASPADETQQEEASETPHGDPSGVVGVPPLAKTPTITDLSAAGVRVK